MKKLATRITPAIKAWIEMELNIKVKDNSKDYFHYPIGYFVNMIDIDYTEVSEAEFLAEFGKPKVEYQYFTGGKWYDIDCPIRIKPKPDYSKEIEALQNKAKENGMSVIIKFEEL